MYAGKPANTPEFPGKVTYSPPPSSEPWRRALFRRPVKAAKEAISSAALITSAETIRSARNT